MKPSIAVKHPNECSAFELAAFHELVRSGGELQVGLAKRLKLNGRHLLFISLENSLIAAGALKRPNKKYHSDTFSKSGTKHATDDFPIELGWCCVSEKFRGKGLSKIAVKTLVAIADKNRENIYATTRNEIMRKTLATYGFQLTGQPYVTVEDKAPLSLLVRFAKT